MLSGDYTAFIAALTVATLLTAGGARAAGQASSDLKKVTPQQTVAAADFSKVSADGVSAFQDITRTRLAIFDGRLNDAKKYVNQADKALGKARTDRTIFTKAEADLKPPASMQSPASNNVSGLLSADDKSGQVKTSVAWLPVDGLITINDDYTADPAKKAAVADANKSLKSGDRKGAMEKLHLADMNITVALAVVPLEKTISNVHQATDLINNGKYYEASQVLRQAQDSERFAATSISGKSSTPTNSGSSTPPTK